ncbi:hypothetical protein [Kitasatospora sp. NPDC048538]|uniref:hypothetical protein n=1 Tax=unclassified Kitasatospora TaxID=2633591 RepID=UPI0034040997
MTTEPTDPTGEPGASDRTVPPGGQQGVADADLVVDVTPAAPQPRSRRTLWLTVAAVLVLGAGGFGVAFADNFANLGAYAYSAPKEFDGLALVPKASVTRRSLRAGSESGVSVTNYRSADEERVVIVTVYEKHIFTPSSELDDLLARQRASGATVTDLHDVDPGERGGVMKCGNTDDDGQQLGFCDWSDGSMWATYQEAVRDTTVAPDTAASHARAFRALAEVPSS